MLYTVGEMAKLLDIPASTLRFYDKEGLLPFVERSNSGIRMFQTSDYEWLHLIVCLKKTGMPLKDIRDFMTMCQKGNETIKDRLALIRKQRETVLAQMEETKRTLAVLDYKSWYYETALEAGTTDVPHDMDLSDVPEQFRETRQMLRQQK